MEISYRVLSACMNWPGYVNSNTATAANDIEVRPGTFRRRPVSWLTGGLFRLRRMRRLGGPATAQACAADRCVGGVPVRRDGASATRATPPLVRPLSPGYCPEFSACS